MHVWTSKFLMRKFSALAKGHVHTERLNLQKAQILLFTLNSTSLRVTANSRCKFRPLQML